LIKLKYKLVNDFTCPPPQTRVLWD